MPRFSIRQLLVATALVAFGCLALLKSSSFLAAAMMGTVALVLVAAAVLAIYRAGDLRAFWLGFAIFGWSYLLLCYGSIFNENNSPIGWRRIITGQLATALYDRIYASAAIQPTIAHPTDPFRAPPPSAAYPADPFGAPPPSMAGGPFGTGTGPQTIQIATGPNPVDFLNVAHSLWATLIAFGGGWFAAWVQRGTHKVGLTV
jgi:hypothetical protein